MSDSPKEVDHDDSAQPSRGWGLSDAGKVVDEEAPVSTFLPDELSIGYTGAGEERETNNPSPKRILDEQSERKFLVFLAKQASLEEVALLAEQGRNANPELAKLFVEQAKPKEPASPKMVAPILWAERTTGREVSPADFIKLHYGETAKDGSWDSQGLTRADLKHIDLGLYNAYSQQIRRNPDAAIQELPTEPKRQEGDPQAILDERRERNRLRMARKRAM